MEPIEIDGAKGEGGGQMLRTAAAFSSILRKPVRVVNIRAGRRTPGLKRQHVSALEVLARATGGRVEGASEGSSQVSFVPGGSRLGSLSLDMGTAASITLVLQAVIPAVALSGGGLRLELTGGTDVPWSPTFDYLAVVVREAFRRIGIEFDATAGPRGYYPRGGGRAVATIRPCASLKPLELLARGAIHEATAVSRCAGLPRHVAERQLSAAIDLLVASGVRAEGEISEERSTSPGSSILVSFAGPSSVLGSDAIGARGKASEEVGREAAAKFVAEVESGACLDSNLADMVVPLLSLAPSPSVVRVREVTSHLKSGMEIAHQFTSCAWSADLEAGSALVRVTPRAAGQPLAGHNV